MALKTAAVVLGLATPSLFAQSDSPGDFQTHGINNGRAWRAFTASMKLAYMSGVYDGLGYNMGPEIVREFPWGMGFNHGEIMQQLDRFYRDSANVRIPIIQALSVVKRKFEGASETELRDLTTSLRATAARDVK